MNVGGAIRLSKKNYYKVLERYEQASKFRVGAVKKQKQKVFNAIKKAANEGRRFNYVDGELLPDVQRYFIDLGYDVETTSTKDTYIGWKTHVNVKD